MREARAGLAARQLRLYVNNKKMALNVFLTNRGNVAYSSVNRSDKIRSDTGKATKRLLVPHELRGLARIGSATLFSSRSFNKVSYLKILKCTFINGLHTFPIRFL